MSAFTALLAACSGQSSARRVRHILPSVTDTEMCLTLSLFERVSTLTLMVDDRAIDGIQVDADGQHWRFEVDALTSATRYRLQLFSGADEIDDAWPLSTFPDPASLPERFRLLTFTCAGGGDGFGLGDRQFFKPLTFRQRLLESALARQPDAAVAIGDHIYWDLRGTGSPVLGRRSGLIKRLSGWYLQWRYGQFDRAQPVMGTANERVLKQIGCEQIADLYGIRFRSTPIFFVGDDHDYFENDDADDEMVTFPPDAFSAEAKAAMARLFYPSLSAAPQPADSDHAGRLRYGRLFEGIIFDCAGQMTVGGDNPSLVPLPTEQWIVAGAQRSDALNFCYIPSHPPGWTAGKWREWYPDVVAPEGFHGVVQNRLLGDTRGRLTVEAQKYLWQQGWWAQHQRLLSALQAREGTRFVVSGDIHAQGALAIERSGELDWTSAPLMSILSGPVSTSDVTWPSSARGIVAAPPAWLQTREFAPTREVNGYTLFEFRAEGATAELVDCGGHDRNLGETGSPVTATLLTL